MDRKWVIPLASAAPILAIVFAFSLGPTPQKILRDSLADADPAEVLPAVASELATKDVARRRYAVEYLGRLKSPSSLPLLESILADAREADYLRADALNAIRAIDRRRAQQHANAHRESANELGRLAREMLAAEASVVGALQ